MTDVLQGRSAIVTGAGQGLGRVYALRLAQAGARVAVVDVLAEQAQAVTDEIEAAGGTAACFEADVTRSEQVTATVQRVVERWGSVEVLVNNAGGAFFPSRPFEEIAEEQWDHVLAVNLKGQWLCARAVAPPMKARGAGRIINITSTVVDRGYPAGISPYIAAKAGVVGLTRALAHELGPHNITVNAVAPGYTPVQTPKAVFTDDGRERVRQQMIDEQCLKRSETPDDLAGAIVFLASDAASFITGQVLNVDGGWAMR